MAPKPIMVSAEELAQCRTELNARIESSRAEASKNVGAAEQRLQNAVQLTTDTIQRNASTAEAAVNRVAKDQTEYTNEECEKAYQRVLPFFPPIEERITREVKAIYEKIDSVDIAVRAAVSQELSLLSERFDKELHALREEIVHSISSEARSAAEQLKQQKTEILPLIEKVRKEYRKGDKELLDKINGMIVETGQNGEAANKAQDDRAARAEAEIWLKLDRHDDEIRETGQKAAAETLKVETEAADSLRIYSEKTDEHLEELDVETKKLRDALTEVENQPTRRVDWVIKNVAQKIRPPSASRTMLHTSWFSPKFNAAGAHGLQLELQLFKPSDPPVHDSDAGDCAVFLWACKGMSLSYKLTVGKKSSTMEKIFNGHVPYGTRRFCWLKDQINREDNTLTVSVEILEAIREVEHPVKQLTAPPIEEGQDIHEYREICAAAERSLDSRVVFRRHINNRMLEQVESQVEMVRSRLVRKVEWRVEHAALLQRCFGPNDPICSSMFNAAGIEGMQLVFYPSGYNNPTEGFCSLYVYCPAGATIKAILWLGTQRRDATHTFTEAGAFGRSQFCRFEAVVDEKNDIVHIVLEVEEAHQDMRATLAHPIVAPGDKRTMPQIDGSSATEINSVVKLQRCGGKTEPGLADVRLLPSLWTAQQVGDGMDTPPTGMHPMSEIKNKALARNPKVPLPTDAPSSSPGLSRAGGNSRSASVPSFQADQTFYGQGDEECTTGGILPRLARTTGGGEDWGHDIAGGRRNRSAGRRKAGGFSNASSGKVSY